MVRMTDTPLDVAMSLSKQELARQVVDANASLAEKDKEIERLRAADPRTSLLTVIADIREKTGVGGKPMLDELADAIAEKLTSKERALAEAVEVLRPFAVDPVGLTDDEILTVYTLVGDVRAARAFVQQHEGKK